jgi:hypothetical protein
MVAQVGNISLHLAGGETFFTEAVMRQNSQYLELGLPKLGKVTDTPFPKKLVPMLTNIPLGNTKRLMGTYTDHLKTTTQSDHTYKVRVVVWTDTDNFPNF